MRVLFVGAGASKAAGYPLGGDLIKAVAAYIESGVSENVKWYWKRFADLPEGADRASKELLQCSNPEVVLSFLDLCAEAMMAGKAEIQAEEQRFFAKVESLAPEQQEPFVRAQERNRTTLYESLRQRELKYLVNGRLGFLAGLDDYLQWRHYLDAKPEAKQRREYLLEELKWLAHGDVIITTNYDALCERVLLDEQRWSPRDGYGFHVDLAAGVPELNQDSLPLPSSIAKQTSIRVLKLHGSCGWRAVGDIETAPVFLDKDFLHYLIFPTLAEHAPTFVYDRKQTKDWFPTRLPVLAVPSFLKRVAGSTLRAIWEQARIALEQATEIRVLGSGLPYSDTAVRTLLSPFGFRLASSEVEITVHDPNSETVERWREHLGSDVKWVNRCIGADAAA